MERREFIDKSISAMKLYAQEKKRIEYLSLAVDSEKSKDIQRLFEIFLPTMLYKSQFGILDYIGVIVNNQVKENPLHMHVLIRKPFVQAEVLRSSWDRVVGYPANLRCITVKMMPQSIERLVLYIADQHIHHQTNDVQFIQSGYWGVVQVKKKQKEEKKENSSYNYHYDYKTKTYKKNTRNSKEQTEL